MPIDKPVEENTLNALRIEVRIASAILGLIWAVAKL